MAQRPVLYVEDEENDALLLRFAFEREQVRTSLEIVGDGPEAVDYLSARMDAVQTPGALLPCLVLLDLNLPTMSGFEVLAWIRAQPQFGDLPVVVFSSSSQPRDKQRALAMGANDYIVKPVDMTRMDLFIQLLKDRWLHACGDSLTAPSPHPSPEP